VMWFTRQDPPDSAVDGQIRALEMGPHHGLVANRYTTELCRAPFWRTLPRRRGGEDSQQYRRPL